MSQSPFLTRALQLHKRGYTVLPVKPTLKRVVIEGWPSLEPTEADIKEWAANGYRKGNIGINTKNTPAVDIDVYDAEVAKIMEDWVIEKFGDACVRVGRAPKRLLLFRTNEPFRKMVVTYTDGQTEHKVEILGQGQQFVAYGIHPDTKAPYQWTSFDEPVDVDASDLPLLRRSDAEKILEHFAEVCEARGWESKSKHLSAEGGGGTGLESYKPVLNISHDTIRETLELIPNKEADYDDYMEIGFALHHQFEGSDEGLQMWHDWAERSSKYEPTDLNRRWDSMGDGEASVTFATLLHKAKKIKSEAADRAFEKALNKIATVRDKKQLQNECIKELVKHAVNDVQIDLAVRAVQDRLGELEQGRKPRRESVAKLFQQAMPKKKRRADTPKWCENWVFVQADSTFYNTITSRQLSGSAFDRTFGRELITDDNRDKGEAWAGKASDAALNLYCIPVVYDYLYFPGMDEFFEMDGNPIVNKWNKHKIPMGSAPKTNAEKKAVRIFERHLEILIGDPRERRLLLDFLAYNVQFPSERVHWAPVLQGVPGGGKSFFMPLMATVLGQSNVGIATVADLHEQYTAWAEGSKMVFFEEVKISGSDKYEVMNKLMPYLTNPTVTVRRMQRNSYKIPNMTNYFMFTNHLDALPFERNDRRYFVLRTTFLTESHINDFTAKNPNYFDELFETLALHGPVLRWYLETHELSSEFRPKAKAPRTAAWDLMYDASVGTDDEDELSQILRDSGNPLLTENVLSAAELREVSGTFGALGSRAFGRAMANAGFHMIAVTRLDANRPKDRFYTRHSGLFTGLKVSVTDRIRQLVGQVDDGLD